MNEETYYFRNWVENDSLRHLSQKAEEASQNIDKVVMAFREYYKVFSRVSLIQFEFLLTLNDKSLSGNDSCSSSSGEKQYESERKSNQQLLTSMKINPNVPGFSRNNLLLDQTEKGNYEPDNLSICSSLGHQGGNINSNKKCAPTLKSFVDKTAASSHDFAQPKISKEATILKNSEIVNKESIRFVRKDKMTVNHTSGDKQSESYCEMNKIMDKSQENNQQYLSSSEKAASFPIQNKNFGNFVKVAKMPDTKSKDIISRISYENIKIVDNRDMDIDEYTKTGKKKELQTPDENRPNTQEVIFTDETIFKINNESTASNQESLSFGKGTEKIMISAVDDETMTSPKIVQKIHKISKEKDQTSCTRKNSVLFGSLPKVKHLNGVIEIVIDASYKADENPSPKSSHMLPKYCKIGHEAKEGKGSPKGNIRRAVSQDLNVKMSSKNIKGRCSSLLDSSSSHGVHGISIQGKDINVLFGRNISSDNLTIDIMLSEYYANVTLPPPIINCSDPNITLEYMAKFVKFCEKRFNYMREINNWFLHFQNHLQFLYCYVKDIEYIIRNIAVIDMKFSNEKFNEINLIEISSKLINKLTLWVKDVETDIKILNQCFKEIQDLRSQNKPLIMKGMPIVNIDFLRMYAQNLKEIWKKMENMVIRGYSRSSLFFNTAHDVEKLITNFVKCLIIVGILKPRTNTRN